MGWWGIAKRKELPIKKTIPFHYPAYQFEPLEFENLGLLIFSLRAATSIPWIAWHVRIVALTLHFIR